MRNTKRRPRSWDARDRKSTRLNSSHLVISYAVFCLKKKTRKLEPWEFETFRVGSKIDFEMAALEESLWAELALTSPESLKVEVNREVVKRVSDIVE